MGCKVIDSYYEELVIYGRSVKGMLEPWEVALSIEERVYPNLVRVFYWNMEISAYMLDGIITNVGVPIEFDVMDLN